MTINALAEAMVTDRTTLGRNIKPLQRDGLIAIEASTSDRRAKELHLTKAGTKRLEQARKVWSQAQARFEHTFGTKRAASLRDMLRDVGHERFRSGAFPDPLKLRITAPPDQPSPGSPRCPPRV